MYISKARHSKAMLFAAHNQNDHVTAERLFSSGEVVRLSLSAEAGYNDSNKHEQQFGNWNGGNPAQHAANAAHLWEQCRQLNETILIGDVVIAGQSAPCWRHNRELRRSEWWSAFPDRRSRPDDSSGTVCRIELHPTCVHNGVIATIMIRTVFQNSAGKYRWSFFAELKSRCKTLKCFPVKFLAGSNPPTLAGRKYSNCKML